MGLTPGADPSPLRNLVCGGAAGITSVTFTYPLDLIRTRLSVQSVGKNTEAELKALPGMWKTLATVYTTEGGLLALYRGIIPTVAGVAPYVCTSSVYDALCLLLIVSGRPKLHDL